MYFITFRRLPTDSRLLMDGAMQLCKIITDRRVAAEIRKTESGERSMMRRAAVIKKNTESLNAERSPRHRSPSVRKRRPRSFNAEMTEATFDRWAVHRGAAASRRHRSPGHRRRYSGAAGSEQAPLAPFAMSRPSPTLRRASALFRLLGAW